MNTHTPSTHTHTLKKVQETACEKPTVKAYLPNPTKDNTQKKNKALQRNSLKTLGTKKKKGIIVSLFLNFIRILKTSHYTQMAKGDIIATPNYL